MGTMAKTHGAHYNNTGSQNLNLEMDLWCAFGKEGGLAYTGSVTWSKTLGKYEHGKFIKTKDVDVEHIVWIHYYPEARRSRIFQVSFKDLDSDYSYGFETLQQAKRYITKVLGTGVKYKRHF